MKDFFISYTGADKQWAEWIAGQLEAEGYTTVFQAWDFGSNGNFVQKMHEALNDSEHTIAVLSPAYMKSEFARIEWDAAFVKHVKEKKGSLLHTRVEDFTPDGLFRPFIYIDLFGVGETEARGGLLSCVGTGGVRPTTPLPFPGEAGLAKTPPPFPGALPPIWNVPHRRNPNFTGREELLTALEKGLASGKPAALTQALAGLGGVGKTQTAVEYAYRHKADYKLVWWIRSEEAATLAADFAELARRLGLPEQDAREQGVIVAAVRSWLEHNPGWLLIFDNAVAQENIEPYLPRNPVGHVIITSRNQLFGEVADVLPIHEWDRAESKDFLAKRTKWNDPGGADAVADALGDLPLALAQAAGYMEATVASYTEYLKLFKERRQDLWGSQPPPKDYPATVGTTWALSIEEAAKAAPGAAELMNLCAFLAPDDIPRDILRDGREKVPEPMRGVLGDDLRMNTVVAVLRRFSLLEVRPDAFGMHRLVQTVVQDRLEPEARKTWCTAATRVVNAAYPLKSEDVTTWPACAGLTPHARAVAFHAESMGVTQSTVARLLNQVGTYLQGRAEFGEARIFFERSLAICEAAYGPTHPAGAIRLNNLGMVLKDLGDSAGARALFERALAIDEAAYGPNHPEVAIRISNLAGNLYSLGDLAGARAHLERALAIFEVVHGKKHPNVATAANNLGMVLKDLGDWPGAQVLFERALTIDEDAYGPNHPNVAVALGSLGLVLQQSGDLPRAQAHFERALDILEAAYESDHPNLAHAVNNLGSVFMDLGDFLGARAHLERALMIMEVAYVPNHPDVAGAVNNLGRVLHELSDLTGAQANFERALEIIESSYGPHHPAVAGTISNLGGVLQDLGDLVGARVHFERALSIYEEVHGLSHPSVARAANNLGRVLQDIGDLAGARAHLERALAIVEASNGPNHPKVAMYTNNLGSLLQDLDDMAGAQAYYQRALAIDESTYGLNHPEVARDVNNLGTVLKVLGDLAGARACYERALAIHRAFLGEFHPKTVLVAENLATLEK